jgi:hypothetical protein
VQILLSALVFTAAYAGFTGVMVRRAFRLLVEEEVPTVAGRRGLTPVA